ncbi:MAG TPA: hypothetical protein ENK23_06060 [Sorangium sp.]|nr:hypothetical protein [Sorangium sp.]
MTVIRLLWFGGITLVKLLRWPLWLCAALLALHALGGRQATVVLSGTAPLGLQSGLGLLYLGLWLGCVVLVPPWMMGSLLAAARRGLRQWGAQRRPR